MTCVTTARHLFFTMKHNLPRITLLPVALCAVLTATPAVASPLGYPGSTWAVAQRGVRFGTDSDNTLLQGKIEQGVDWLYLPGTVWRFNTYGSFTYSTDSVGYSYNNKASPAIGMKLTRRFDSSSLEVGVQYGMERRWRGENTTVNGVTAYVSFWSGWDLSVRK